MTVLVVGSIAYDNILKYDGNLKSALEDETINGMVNMSVRANHFSRELGGTGLNVSYNLSLLNEQSILLGAIGEDFKFTDFIKDNVNLNYVFKSELLISSNSYITTDDHGNQLSVFYPGAMAKADYIKIDNVTEEFHYAIISPTKKEAMFYYLEGLQGAGVKIFFDPGQQLSVMTSDELEVVMDKADYLIVNKHEFSLFKKISKLSAEEIVSAFEKVIITFGEDGSKIIDSEGVIEIPAQKLDDVIDVTGVGEAFRAGLLKGLSSGYSWKISGQIGTLLASFCLGAHGAQSHFIDKKQFEMWFAGEYKEFIKLT